MFEHNDGDGVCKVASSEKDFFWPWNDEEVKVGGDFSIIEMPKSEQDILFFSILSFEDWESLL